MNLVSVYHVKPASKAHHILYQLLQERTPAQAISHRGMPEFQQHVKFVNARPYQAWYFIEVGSKYVGACYISRQREIGIFVFREFHGKGYGRQAVQMLMEKHPGRLLANVNPENEASIKLWESMGFRKIQWTYENRSS